jgi:arylamine N-acetyltransferase
VKLRELAETATDAAWLDAYVAFLGVKPQATPSLASLRQLTREHLLRVPFENISSILRRARSPEGAPVPPLDRHAKLDVWLDRHGGGVCFEVADMFGALLTGLGFDAHLVLARITFVGSHQAVVVHVDEDRYLVDVGNGAPFFEPIPVSDPAQPFELRQSGLTYRFRADSERGDCWIQDRLIDGNWQPFCNYDLSPADESQRQGAYQRHHVRGQSWVVDNVRLIRCTDSEVWVLYDGTLTRIAASGKSTHEVHSTEDYEQIAAEIFNLPNAPITEALNATQRAAAPG